MDLKKLKTAIGQKVFVVSMSHGVLRTSDYGKLTDVNEPNNIVLNNYMSDSIIPIENEMGDKILKVYNKEGYVVYDNEKKK